MDKSKLNEEYAVEVSGWDNDENFFVEKTRLEWNERNSKKVILRHRVRVGAMVFLRLLDAVEAPANLPMAFRASRIPAAAARGCVEVHLDQLWPRREENTRSIRDAAATPQISAPSRLLIQ